MLDQNLHPGALLLKEIGKRNMKQNELAIRTGVSEKHISTVINGTKPISVSFARKLDIALGDEIGTWAEHQSDYDNYMAQLEEENDVSDEEHSILKRLRDVVGYFLKAEIMHNHCGDVEKILQLRQLLCVNNLSFIPRIKYNAAYRMQISSRTNVDPYVLFAWQRMCELRTQDAMVDSAFQRDKLKESIPKIKEQLFEHDPKIMINNLKAIFAECGVAFEVVKHFRGAPVQGFIKETDGGKVILCVTIRGKTADRFWFSLFHEVGHLMNGDLNVRFVDFDSEKSNIEDRADVFARDTLIAPGLYKALVSSDKYHTLDDIKKFSDFAGVPYWVVIGRLHNDEWLDWSYFAHETPSFEWADE